MEPFERRINTRKAAEKKGAIVFRTTPEEYDMITEAAERMKMNKSDFIRYCIREQIEK